MLVHAYNVYSVWNDASNNGQIWLNRHSHLMMKHTAKLYTTSFMFKPLLSIIQMEGREVVGVDKQKVSLDR